MAPFLVLTLFLIAVTLIYYFQVGLRIMRDTKRAEDFVLLSRSLPKTEYAATFIATSVSLATALAFFVQFGSLYGLAVIISPVMFSIGVVIFRWLARFLEADGYFKSGTTLHRYLEDKFNSGAVHFVATAISLIGYLGILVIELWLGVTIFSVFSENLVWQTVVAVSFLLLVFLYTFMGGYRAVIETDMVQLILICVGILALLVALIAITLGRGQLGDVFQIRYLNPLPTVLPIAFIIVMVIGNVPFQLLKMSNWHRASASGSRESVEHGLSVGWKWTFGIWFGTTLCGVFAGILLHPGTEGWGGAPIHDVLTLLIAEVEAPVGAALCQYIVFPLLFVGCTAAMISTADSVFVPILASYVYDLRFKKQHIEDDDAKSQHALKATRKAILLFLFGAAGLYVALVHGLGFGFVDLVFVFFNQQLVLFPTVWLAVMNGASELRQFKRASVTSIIVGAAATWALAGYGAIQDKTEYVMLSAAVGFVGAIVVFYLTQPSAIWKLRLLRHIDDANSSQDTL